MNEIKKTVPEPKDPDNMLDQFDSLYQVIKILRLDCPWDREQTHQSISHLLIEEAYEALEAIEKNDSEEFAKELGDLLLHILMHCVIAEERGAFDFKKVTIKLKEKLVHRHPHVFSNVSAEKSSDVSKNWEALKMKEGRRSILEGVPKSLPALLRAQRMQHKAANIGFDWDNKADVWNKVDEEYSEFKRELLEGNKKEAKAEFGDLIFSLVNAARYEDIVAEESLQSTNEKFKRRFNYIETKAKEAGKEINKMTLEEMDLLWNEAKSLEK